MKESNTQGIFFRDQLGNMPYANVKISDNLIDGTGYSGIRIGHVNGLTVSDNQLTTNPGTQNETYVNIYGSDQVVLTNNSAISIGFTSDTNVTETGDHLVGRASDYGNANLAAWLHAHGMDSLYTSLANPELGGSTDAHTGPTTPAPVVVPPGPMTVTDVVIHMPMTIFGSDFTL